jgi:hypothetical protein
LLSTGTSRGLPKLVSVTGGQEVFAGVAGVAGVAGASVVGGRVAGGGVPLRWYVCEREWGGGGGGCGCVRVCARVRESGARACA